MLSQMARFHSFLWLGNIPLYVQTTSYIPVHLPMDTSVTAVLAAVHTAAVNAGARALFLISVFTSLDLTQKRNCWTLW